ncbi:YrhC family protein [Halobacillus mangrovi]|uniref:YrhC family protein n=1 Tax=Halobacillus mangrovi TaxID=402384 RepID=UPI003D9656C9
MQSTEWIEKKIKDYKRFILTLLIFSSYLYAGTLISIYEYRTTLHFYLYPLILIGLATAFLMILKVRKWKQVLSE